jgi:hypothetical protein
MSDQLVLWPEESAGDRLSWSWSRDQRLRFCARKYWLHHYGSRGGWEPGATRAAREAYVLRQLQTRYMWVGRVVHELIELTLGAWRRGDTVNVDGLVERGTRRMRAQYAESIQGVYWERPMAACGLVEHEYGEAVSRAEWQEQRDRMERCVRAFFALPLTAELQRIPAWRWLAIEALGSFELDGATVVVRPDLAWWGASSAAGAGQGGRRVVIADWKTGRARPDDERLQLSTYGLYARRNWGVGAEGLLALAVHLDGEDGAASVDEHAVLPVDLDAVEDAVRSSVASMRTLAASAADPAAFPMTADLGRCAGCAFRRLCGR